MKKLLLTFLIFLSTASLSETYVCSHELSRYGRSGEIETVTYQRIGNSFSDDLGGKIEISYETQSDLILTEQIKHLPALLVTFINKKSKEWGYKYLDMSVFRKHPPGAFTYGKCTVVK